MIIKLTENKLRRLIKESIRKHLNEDISNLEISNNIEDVKAKVKDLIKSHRQYFAPDCGVFAGRCFYIEKIFNNGMGQTRLCKIDPQEKIIYLTYIGNGRDFKYLSETFPDYEIKKDEKFNPWDKKTW